MSLKDARLARLPGLGLDRDEDIIVFLELADDCLVHGNTLGDVEHHHDGEGAEKQLPGQVHVVDAFARDGYAPLLDGRDVGVSGVGEDDGGVGPFHDDLQVDVPLAEDGVVVLGRDLHRREHGHRARAISTPIVLKKRFQI